MPGNRSYARTLTLGPLIEGLYGPLSEGPRPAQGQARGPTCSIGAIANAHEPADWVVNRGVASVYAFDAMGHGLNASVIGALGVTAMRNARRAGLGLVERFAAANDAIHRQFGCMSTTVVPFATAAALEVDITTGKAVALSAGHPWPYRLARAGPARSS